MTPEQAYLHAIEHENFSPDPLQEKAVQLTQMLYQQLIKQSATRTLKKSSDSFWLQSTKHKLRSLFLSSKEPEIKGLYFWGGVGRGKTWLIDSFFKTLPFANKRRIHFHSFMLEIHEQLKTLPKTPDPLPIIAKQMAQEFHVLCIDEFHVHDITDAMLVAGLLKALFNEKIIIVTTSNVAPDDLYKNGLQRDSFLPAIQQLKLNTHIFELDNNTDYRAQLLEKEGYYHAPLSSHNNDMMAQHFITMSQHAPIQPQHIEVNTRNIKTLAVNTSSQHHPEPVIWFEFDEICNTARSSTDYLWIAQQYPNVLISNVYKMNEEKDDVAKRFVHLIDALYDKHCFLVISAEAEPDELYLGRRLKLAFPRTASRLKAMRSKLYRGKQNCYTND